MHRFRTGKPSCPCSSSSTRSRRTRRAWLNERMAGRERAAADAFGLADCAAAPAPFYADWTHPTATSRDQSRSRSQNTPSSVIIASSGMSCGSASSHGTYPWLYPMPTVYGRGSSAASVRS